MLPFKTLTATSFAGALALTASAAIAQDAPAEADAQAEAATDTEAEVAAETEAEPTTNIAQALRASTEHTTLVSAMEQAGLAAELAGTRTFTVFAPTDSAFAQMMRPEDLDSLMQEESRPFLRQMMSYFIVPGAYDIETLVERAEAAGGQFTLPTLEGSVITVQLEGAEGQRAVRLTGESGAAYISEYDLAQSNGMVHVINGLLVPEFEEPEAAADAAIETEAEAETDGGM